MTKINRMVLHGFKSFAKRTELIFGNDFNCILGPNGSGKSNILDALCFVLGKSSAKSLRAEKTSNLIYNGGKSKKGSKFAEVSIFFDNSSKIFPTEDREVKLTRLVKPSGQGVYKINDETRTRSQILELLSLANINPDGYNIILQGDIIRLIDMSPNERRQIIEEIAGISVYEEKKRKAVGELDKVDGRLKEAEIILTERDGYLKELKKERDQAQKYRDLDEKINVNKATHIHRQVTNSDAEKEELDERIKGHKEKLEKVNDNIKKLHTDVSEGKKDIESINQEIEEKGEKEQVALHKEIEKLKVESATSKNRMENCKDEIGKIKNRRDNLKENLREVDDKLKQIELQKKDTQKQIETRTKEYAELQTRIKIFREKNALDGLAEIETEVDSLDRIAEEKQKEIQELRQKQQELLREKDKLEFQVEAIDQKVEKVLEVEKEHKDQIIKLKQMKVEFKKSTLELNTILNDDAQIAAELGSSRRRLLEANEELSKLNARNASIQEKLGGDIALKRIMELKRKMNGIYGTVSELGEVSKKYSLALEISAGNKLKSIVVESDRVAAECISYLKKNKLGVATFLPLNKVRPARMEPGANALLSSGGVHGKAVELVSYDPKFKSIFSYVFGNTLVVDSIAVARKIGVGKAKMVTLDGDVTEISGAMQGGYRQKRPGLGFSEKEVSKAIREYEKVSAEMGQNLVKLEKTKQSNEEKIMRLRELKAHLEGDIIKLEKSLHLDSDDIDASKKVKKELTDKIKGMDKQLEEVVVSVSKVNRELADSKIKKQQMRMKINELRNPILLAELNAFEEKRSELKESKIKLESQLHNFKTQAEAMLLPEKENLGKAMKQHDKEEETFKSQISEIAERVKVMDSELKDKEKSEKAFYAQFKGLFTRRTKLSEDVQKKEAKVYLLNDDVRKIEHKINTINLEVARIDAVLGGLKKECEQYEGVGIDPEKSDAQIAKEIGQFERMVENMGAVNMKALEIYDGAVKEYHELRSKKQQLHGERDDVLSLIAEIEQKKAVLFTKTFDVIQENFKNIFASLLTKGDAYLELEDQVNPFEGGMQIKVKLTGSKFLDIRSLSGGEKTMTALAFLFSVQEHEPASFYVLDEVDAALDKKNSDKLAELVKQYCSKAQYIMISHNDGVITKANNLYGVSMNQHGVSHVVSLKI